MPNQYTRLTKENILRKMNRRNNPVTSVAQLAREFGVNTAYVRATDVYGREGKVDNAAPKSFRMKVQALIGQRRYNQLRQSQNITLAYR